MRDLLRRFTLERALQLLIVLTIVTSVLAAGAVLGLLDLARKARWAALLALAALAVLYALGRWQRRRLGPSFALAAALLALAFVSTAWSAHPGLTFARASSLAILFVACAALAIGAAGRLASVRRAIDAVVAGTAVVALGGLLVLLFASDRAVQPASAQEAARYQGLGGGPNTAAMVLAVGLPLAAHLLVESRSARARLLALGLGALLLGSIVASGSRGALLAAFAGLAAYAVLGAHGARTRLLGLTAVGVLLAASILVARLPQPDPAAPARLGTVLPSSDPAPGYLDANDVLRQQEDVGRPAGGGIPEDTERTVLGLSGRRQAWEGALRLGVERPALGYAFGTENKVFVDRYLEHGSNLPENSYIGLFLQLGAGGVALFLLLVGALLTTAVRSLRRAGARSRRVTAACAGGLVAGLALSLTQSFIYAAGSNATAAVWLCAFLIPASARVDAG
ncbi:MAG: O-antigen ligase family protein [Gaiellaceae bacterium]